MNCASSSDKVCKVKLDKTARCLECQDKKVLCSLGCFFTDFSTVEPTPIHVAIARKYHYEALEMRDEDENAVVPLQPPKVPIEWKEALKNSKLAGSGQEAATIWRVINKDTYLSLANEGDDEDEAPPMRPVKPLPKSKGSKTTPAPSTRNLPARTTPGARASFGPAPAKLKSSRSQSSGKSKKEVFDCESLYDPNSFILTSMLYQQMSTFPSQSVRLRSASLKPSKPPQSPRNSALSPHRQRLARLAPNTRRWIVMLSKLEMGMIWMKVCPD